MGREQNVRIPDERDVIPFVQESVFLHPPDFRCELRAPARIDLYGLDGNEPGQQPARHLRARLRAGRSPCDRAQPGA